ncbi:MAG: CHAD domain-containing protein [Bacteroidetes bacterium]|nr:CHAD domain-containing protein [Bacteroidota bacterium]
MANVFSRKEQRAALQQLGLTLQLHYLAYCLHGKGEDLHRWRIAMKRVRAFQALYALNTERKHVRKVLRPLRRLYRQTGLIRQSALNAAALKRMTPEFEGTETADKASPEAALLRQCDRANHWVRQYIQLLRKASRSLSNRQLRRHFSGMVRDLDKNFRRMHAVEELHDCRRVIKHLIYQHQALPEHIQRKMTLKVSYLQEIEEAIGAWHDAALALEWGVSQSLLDHAVLTRLERESAALLEQALKKTRNFKTRAKSHGSQ